MDILNYILRLNCSSKVLPFVTSAPPKSKPVEKAEIAFTAGFVMMVLRG
jgi:hypothetical protein